MTIPHHFCDTAFSELGAFGRGVFVYAVRDYGEDVARLQTEGLRLLRAIEFHDADRKARRLVPFACIACGAIAEDGPLAARMKLYFVSRRIQEAHKRRYEAVIGEVFIELVIDLRIRCVEVGAEAECDT